MLNYEPDATMRWDFDDLGIGEGILHIEWTYVIWVWNKESQTLLIILPMNMEFIPFLLESEFVLWQINKQTLVEMTLCQSQMYFIREFTASIFSL